jgi:hypothetical protein
VDRVRREEGGVRHKEISNSLDAGTRRGGDAESIMEERLDAETGRREDAEKKL